MAGITLYCVRLLPLHTNAWLRCIVPFIAAALVNTQLPELLFALHVHKSAQKIALRACDFVCMTRVTQLQ